MIPKMIDYEMYEWRTEVIGEIRSIRTDTKSELTKIRNDVQVLAGTADTRINSIEKQTFKRIDVIETKLFSKLDDIQNKELHPVSVNLTKLLETYNDVPATVGKRFDVYTDCEKNAFCIQGVTMDTLLSVRSMSNSGASTFTQLSQDSSRISNNFNKVSTDLTIASDSFAKGFPVIVDGIAGTSKNLQIMTVPKWYDRLINYAVSGSLLYFNTVGGIK